MISEFAIEPEVMAQWANFRTLWGDFGIAQRRQVGLYPKKWKQAVMERARALTQEKINTEIQVAKMEARLSGIESKPKFRKTDCSDWEDARPWLSNAVSHAPAFPAIVSGVDAGDERVINIDDLLRDEAPYFQSPEVQVERSAAAIIEMLWPLLAQSREIVLVDPNFDPREPRFVNVVEGIIDRLNSIGQIPKRFEVHTSKYSGPRHQGNIQFQERHYRDGLGPILFGGWQLTVCCWAENAVGDYQHPRFVLTEIGGIHLDWGLDEGEAGTTTIAKGLGESFHGNCFKRYACSGEIFANDGDNTYFQIT